MRRAIQLFVLGSLLLALGGLSAPVAHAADSKTNKSKAADANISQAVIQSYNADVSVQQGMIVRLKDKDPGSVEQLTQDKISSMLGVIVPANDATVTLTPQTAKQQQVFVATSGRYTTLVSNQNGPIKAGDLITISALAGIGMRANENQSIVLGKALDAFEGTGNVIGKVSIKDATGKANEVSIGRVTVTLDITHNPLESKSSDYVPGFLSKAAVTVANKPVSTARIYLGLVVLLISAFVTGNIVYSGVRNGMVAIGRNPLSKKSIIKSLVQTVIAGLIIFIVGVFAVYLLLKL